MKSAAHRILVIVCLAGLALTGCKNLPSSLPSTNVYGVNTNEVIGVVRDMTQENTREGQEYNQVQQSGNVQYAGGRPADFNQFKQRYRSMGTNPEGAVRLYFDALYSYIDPARHAEGAKMLRYSLHERQEWEGSSAWATFVSRLKNPSYHYIFRSFAAGTSPQNSYSMSPDNYQLNFIGTRQESDHVQVFVRSSGADSPRYLRVKQFEDGLWYVINNHGTYSEVRMPANQVVHGGHDADLD